MGETMRRIAVLLLASLVVVSAATASPRSDNLVSKAVQALGGESALANVKTVAVKGTIRQWEPEQSVMPGGDMRLVNDSTFDIVVDYGARASRVDWVRNYVYPAPRTYTFSEVITPDAGYVIGIDATARTKQSMESNPPAHWMSGLARPPTQVEMRRTPPMMYTDMLHTPARVPDAPDITSGGVSYPAVNYTMSGQTFTVAFDPQTGLPARIRSLDYDNIWGDVNYDVVLSDWRSMGGRQVATTQQYQLNGRTIAERKITDVQTNVPVAADRLTIPAEVKASAPKPAVGPGVQYQWVIRRQFIGTYLDSDNPSFDTRATSGLRLSELGPGLQHVVGGTHNSLIVEMKDHLIVFDAPVTDAQSNWTLDAARQKFAGKPVKYLVLTHHHMDHAGGIRAYAAQGATIVVGKGAAEHFRSVLAAPFRRNPDLQSRDLSRTPIMEVADKQVLSDGQREVVLYVIENPHATASLIGYVPDARLGFVTDLWTPGPPLGATLNPGQAAVVAAVKKAGISPLKFAGGHGSTAEYAALAALDGK